LKCSQLTQRKAIFADITDLTPPPAEALSMISQICGCKYDQGTWVELCPNHRHVKPGELPTLRQMQLPVYKISDYASDRGTAK
jgi:hypothetical protein